MIPREVGEFEPGEVIVGRYEVIRVLGKGGMGRVYLVTDRETDRQLALKTLLPEHASNERALHRFIREVKAVRHMHHPGIVRIHDARRDGALLYYTMDYVEGKSLHRLIRERGRLGLGSTVRIMSLLCHALEHAHHYTIHRDLSPDNVMVLPDGSIRLLDFGLAKLNDAQGQFTMIGTSLGKLQYNSPEQRRNAADVDHRTDIYSLGVIFYVMLTGSLPKAGRRISELRPDLPIECNDVYSKATELDPNARYADARAMRHALMAVYETASKRTLDEVPPPPPEAPTAVSPARRPWWAGVWARVSHLWGGGKKRTVKRLRAK